MFVPLLGIGLLLVLSVLLVADWIARRLLYPPRRPLTATPRDYGLTYEDVTFASGDGLALRGWWIPADAPAGQRAPVVVLLHPLFGNRLGYDRQPVGWLRLRQPEVDLLDLAARLHKAQQTVLLFDFRGHGESQGGMCGGGLTEDQDVAGAVDYAFSRAAAEAPCVGLVGFGLGACAALAAIGRYKGGTETLWVFSGDSEGGSDWTKIPPANIKLLSFLVAVQPVSVGTLLRGFLRQKLGRLGNRLAGLVNQLCLWRGGYPLDPAALLKAARCVTVPVVWLQARSDPEIERVEAQALYDAISSRKHRRWVEALEGVGAEAGLQTLVEGALTLAGEASPTA